MTIDQARQEVRDYEAVLPQPLGPGAFELLVVMLQRIYIEGKRDATCALFVDRLARTIMPAVKN